MIVPVVDSFETDDGLGIVMPWARGESLVDAYDAAVPAPDDPGSPYERFLQQPPERLAAVVGQIIDAHVAVASAGFVAVDLYSGCLLYDFETGSVSLIDLDMYRPGPYVLEGDRQYGSASLMPPEEFERGATIDERATVFTLGRMALVYLGCARKAAPERRAFRGTELQWDTAMKATRAAPAHRYSTVAALASAWSTRTIGEFAKVGQFHGSEVIRWRWVKAASTTMCANTRATACRVWLPSSIRRRSRGSNLTACPTKK